MGALVIHVDFNKRVVVNRPMPSLMVNEPQTSLDVDPIAHWKKMVSCIEARFGSEPPEGGCVYKQKLTGPAFDSYGRGCINNSIHEYRGKDWNRPMPFPCDLEAVEAYLIKNKGKVLRLGLKSDPLMWMDTRYSVTKSVIAMATKYNVRLVIYTMSDLCAHEDYLTLIKEGSHRIGMRMGFKEFKGDERLERLVSPGAPSLKRRALAIENLKAAGVEVSEIYNSVHTLTKAQQKEYSQRTGAQPWMEGAR